MPRQIKSMAKIEQMPSDLTGHTPYGVSKLVGDLYTQEYGHIQYCIFT